MVRGPEPTAERVRPPAHTLRWPRTAPGPTATAAQRARRRGGSLPSARVLVFSQRPPAEFLRAALEDLGFQAEWTASGAEAISEAAAGDLALCILDIGRESEEGLEYLPCLNQVDPWLPVIVVNDRDSLDTQRRVRSCRVFYYLVGATAREQARAVIDAAARERVR